MFRQPCDPQRMFIQRVVAVGGDTVEVACGRLYVNGTLAPSTLVDANATYEDFDGERNYTAEVARYRETLDGTTYDVFRRRADDVAVTSDFPRTLLSPSCTADGAEGNPDQQRGTVVETPGATDPCAPSRHFVVPPSSLFVMGDNRDNSNDSRFWGVVPTSHVVGRTVGVFWPLGRMRNL